MKNNEDIFVAQVTEVRLDHEGNLTTWIACPPRAIPAPGRYMYGWLSGDSEEPVGVPLFAAQVASNGFQAAPPVPAVWGPGAVLSLRGPLGYGFDLPATARRVALVALDNSIARLLPLIDMVLRRGLALVLFGDRSMPTLPAAVEVVPLNALSETLTWADYLGVDLPIQRLPDLRAILGLEPGAHFSACTGQALVFSPMPCGGLADCGVCSLPAKKHWRLACKDGPVFDLNMIL